MKNNSKKNYLIITIISVICITLGVSFAYWIITRTQESNNIITSLDCLDTTLTDLNSAINLNNEFPVHDEEGMKYTPYSFKVTNNCDIDVLLQINLEVLNNTTLAHQYLRASLNDYGNTTDLSKVLTDYDNVEETILNATSYNMHQTLLKAYKEKSFDLRLWIDKDTPIEQGFNKLANGKIVIIASPIKDQTFGMLKEFSERERFMDYLNGDVIESIEFLTNNIVPANAKSSKDVSLEQDGGIMAWATDVNDNGLFEVYVGAKKGKVKANPNSQNLFSHLSKIQTLNVENIDTSSVTNMTSMFLLTGMDIPEFKLIGLDTWDTSEVTNMSEIFFYTGSFSTELSLSGIKLWDVSKVENMSKMFYFTGCYNSTFTFPNLSAWDTRNVTDMSYMFNSLGQYSEVLTLTGLENWNTSKVTDMSNMFSFAGYGASNFILNLSNWDVSQVINTSYMFSDTLSLKELRLDNWSVPNANKNDMFYGTNYEITIYVKNNSLKTWLKTNTYFPLEGTITII